MNKYLNGKCKNCSTSVDSICTLGSITLKECLLITSVGSLKYRHTHTPRFLAMQCCHGNAAPEGGFQDVHFTVWPILFASDPPWGPHPISCVDGTLLTGLLWPSTSAGGRSYQLAERHPTSELYTAAQLGLPDYITHQHPHRPCSHYPSPPTLPPTNAPLALLKAEVYCHKSTPMPTQPGLIFEEDSALKNIQSNRNLMQGASTADWI